MVGRCNLTFGARPIFKGHMGPNPHFWVRWIPRWVSCGKNYPKCPRTLEGFGGWWNMISLSSRATAGRAQVSWMKRHSLLKVYLGRASSWMHKLDAPGIHWWSGGAFFASFHVERPPPPSNDDILWLGSSKIARSDLVGLWPVHCFVTNSVVTTNGADTVHLVFLAKQWLIILLAKQGFCCEIHCDWSFPSWFLGSSVPLGTPFLPRILLSEGFGSSIFFGANPSDTPVKPSQTSHQKKGVLFPSRSRNGFWGHVIQHGALQSKVKGGWRWFLKAVGMGCRADASDKP